MIPATCNWGYVTLHCIPEYMMTLRRWIKNLHFTQLIRWSRLRPWAWFVDIWEECHLLLDISWGGKMPNSTQLSSQGSTNHHTQALSLDHCMIMSSFQQYHKIADKIKVIHVWQMVLTTEQAPVADSDGKEGRFNKSYLLTVCMFVNYIISTQQQNLCIFMWILWFLLSLTIYCSTERYFDSHCCLFWWPVIFPNPIGSDC